MTKHWQVCVLLLAALLAAGCTANGGAIFAIIEQEVATPPSNLEDTASVLNVFALPGGDVFVAVAPALYRGTQTTAGSNDHLTWTAVTGQPVGSSCLGAVLGSDGNLYALFAAAGSPGLYQAPLPADFGTAAEPALAWVEIDVGLAGRVPNALLAVSGATAEEVFVVTRLDGVLPTYGLSYLDLSAAPAASDALGGSFLSSPVIDGAYGSGSYWFISGDVLLTGASPTGPLAPSADATVTGIADGVVFGGVYADTTSGRLHLSTRDGQTLVLDGVVWTASAELVVPGKDTKISFTDFVGLSGGNVYVGTAGRGFYLLTDGLLTQTDVDSDTGRLPDKTINELYTGTIQRMIRTSDVVFLLTAGSGLWHQVAGSELTPKDWRWE